MSEYDINKALKAIEEDLIASMVRNFGRHRAEEDKLGINWAQWQTEQLAALDRYKNYNRKKYGTVFSGINERIGPIIQSYRAAGNADQEASILEAIKHGAKLHKAAGKAADINAQFFHTNNKKMDALIKATVEDMSKAEYATLRMANDKYRQIIFNAQVYANSGAGTYEKAVDMATKDFLRAGINCVEYKNGARHTLSDYADMAIRTANKRAYLTGEGEMRKKWGIATVIMNKRGNPCPKCLPFVGKILIDDVWSGGTPRDGPYPLMSKAIAAGLYHPRCKDSHTTYFPGVSTPPDDKYTKEEISDIESENKKEAQRQYASNQAEKYDRMARYSLNTENQKIYGIRADYWKLEAGGREAAKNTGKAVYYDESNDYSIQLEGYSEAVNRGLSEAARKVAQLGGRDGYEHMYLVDLTTGVLEYYETNELPNEVGYDFWKVLKEKHKSRYGFIHNHNTDGSFSEADIITLLTNEQIPVMIAVRNDAVKYVAERKGDILENGWVDDLYQKDIDNLNKALRDGKITSGERSKMREEIIVSNLLRDYTKGGTLIELDGRK